MATRAMHVATGQVAPVLPTDRQLLQSFMNSDRRQWLNFIADIRIK